MAIKLKLINLNQSGLNQTRQSTKSNFAMIKQQKDGTFVNTTQVFRCRDYFNDLMYVQHHPDHELNEQYGFKWYYDEDLTKDLKEGKPVKLLLNHDASYKNWRPLHNIEDCMDIRHTKLIDVEIISNKIPDKCYDKFTVLEVDALWFSSSVMLSLYTMYVRLIAYGGENVNSFIDIVKHYEMHQGKTDDEFIDMIKMEQYGNLDHLQGHFRQIIGINVGQPICEDDLGCEEEDALSNHVHDGSGILSYMSGLKTIRRCNVSPAIRGWVDNFKKLYVIPRKKKVKEAA